jgi:hypothetical protein
MTKRKLTLNHFKLRKHQITTFLKKLTVNNEPLCEQPQQQKPNTEYKTAEDLGLSNQYTIDDLEDIVERISHTQIKIYKNNLNGTSRENFEDNKTLGKRNS